MIMEVLNLNCGVGGGGGLDGARDIPSSCIMRKMLLFVTYSAGIYLHTFSHKKKKA